MPSIPSEIAGVSILFILGGIVGLIILSVGVYTFVLAPEDTTADLFRAKESIDPLSKSLTGVGYDSELPSESKLKRLENGSDDSDEEEEDEEDDDSEYEYDDEDDSDEDFDESALLASLTGGPSLKSADDDEDEKPEPKKKKVKKKVAKKAVTKKKVVRKAAPAKEKPKAAEPAVDMGEGVKRITCPSCEKVHNVEESIGKFICTCGRRIRV